MDRQMDNQQEQEELLKEINNNKGILYRVCYMYCKNGSDREDLAQEIVYQLLRSYPSFKKEFRFSTWMYRISLNTAISFYRKSRTRAFIALAAEHEDQEDKNDDAHRREYQMGILEQFIRELKELDKALMLLYLESKSHREISEILGITETNVATKVSRIKETLKQKFSNLNP
jgi:RNA polymerase sigma-70 factor (ECF subfamily)